jgi:CO/xanthine dehydrogenase FAD-binding subunit
MMRFEYYEPKSIAEAISFANHLPGKAKWLAGGTELLPKLKQRALMADHIINLKKIPELVGISQNDSAIRIGSLTTLEELATSKLVTRSFPALSEAAYGVATPNIRRAATIGGNLCQAPNCLYFVHRNLWRLPECYGAGGNTCNAIKGARKCTAMSPVDTGPALIVLGAELEIKGSEKKGMSLESFFLSSGVSALHESEIITTIVIPDSPLQSGLAYLKYSRRKTIDYAIVSVGVRLVLEPDRDRCLQARVALGGMGTIPFRASEAEEILTGERITAVIISKAAEVASQTGQPWTDIYASNYYRRHLAGVGVRRAVSLAFTRARAAG